MKRFFGLFVTVVTIIVSMVGCISAGSYQKKHFSGFDGYEVTESGNVFMDYNAVRDAAIKRAARLVQSLGYEKFIIIDGDASSRTVRTHYL